MKHLKLVKYGLAVAIFLALLHFLIFFCVSILSSHLAPIAVRIFQQLEKDFIESFANCHNSNFNIDNITISNKSIIETTNFNHFTYIINQANICANYSPLKLLSVVITSPVNYNRRYFLRRTWTSSLSTNQETSVVFFTGLSRNKKVNSLAIKEATINKDLVIVNFHDSYRNLSLKIVLMLKWIHDYCPNAQFVLKCDDDMFINTYNLLTFINSQKLDSRAFYGRLLKKTEPIRSRNSTWAKWLLTDEEYSESKFPNYVSGPAYLFGTEGIGDLLNASLKLPYIYLEDVFVTGICASVANYCRINNKDFINDVISVNVESQCEILKIISAHKVYGKRLNYLWQISSNFNNYVKCKIDVPKLKNPSKNVN